MPEPWQPTEFQRTCAGLINGAPDGELTGLEGARRMARIMRTCDENKYRMAFIGAMNALVKRGYATSRRRTYGNKPLVFALTDKGRELLTLTIEVRK